MEPIITAVTELPEGHLIEMEYKKLDDTPKVFIDQEGNVIGYIWFTIFKDCMEVHMIEIIEKEQGYGTTAIEFLFNNFPIQRITGEVLEENGMRPYWFWSSLGAILSIPSEEAENNIIRDCYFTLERNVQRASA